MRNFFLLKYLIGLILIRLKCEFFSLEKITLELKNDFKKVGDLKANFLIDSVESVAWRFPWLNTCLFKSIYLCGLLKKNGHNAHLKFGFKKEGSQLLAHAWLEDESSNIIYSNDTNLNSMSKYSKLN